MIKNIKIYCLHHRYAVSHMVKQWRFSLVMVLLTLFLLSISLLIPALLMALLENGERLTQDWETRETNITLYLSQDVNLEETQNLMNRLSKTFDVLKLKYISPEEGKKEFEKISGLSSAFAALETNPLPGVIELALNNPDRVSLRKIEAELKEWPNIREIELDPTWASRLFHILAFVKRLAYSLFVILALAVILTVANAIRTTVQYHQREIQVLNLMGAADHFIRRPFLYSGFFYGLLGGSLAVLASSLVIHGLNHPMEKLTELYNSSFKLQGLSFNGIIILLTISTGLGVLSAWLSITWHSLKKEIN